MVCMGSRRRPAAWLMCLSAWLLAPAVGAADAGDVLVSVGEAAIRQQDVDVVLRRLGLADAPAGPQRLRAEAAVLEQLVDEQILRIELDRIGITVPDLEVDAALRRLREQVAGRGGDFEAFLAATGRSPTTIRGQLALELRLAEFVRGQLTDEAIATAFEQNRRELDGTRLRVSHILFRPDVGGDADLAAGLLQQAGAIRSRVLQGRMSFADAARMHSAGPSRRSGGDIGWIGREGPMIDGFSAQAYRLSKGSVSEPFVTPFGVHLVTVTGVEEGRVGLDAVRPRLEKLLAARLVQGLVAQGRERTPVTFAAGVAHFDPATAGRPADERPVIGPATPDG
jgi:parvulin-like peptidyl-prolyl isomerase